jgi:hypothetical protein
LPPLNLYARVRFCLYMFAHETAGAACTRSSLRLLFLWAKRICKTSGGSRREIAHVRHRPALCAIAH